jgi:hypothetical protein
MKRSMKRVRGVGISAALALGLAACGNPYEEGLAKARANDASAEGQAYAGPLGETLGPGMQEAMKGCVADLASAPKTDFSIVLSVGADGTPSNLMARPDSPATKCVIDGVAKLKLPPPPRPDWWVVIEMKTEQ